MTNLKEIVLFSLDEPRYALPLFNVEQVARAVEITPLPAAPAADGDAMAFDGKQYNIAASREHILRLLLATYEVASLQNRQLQEACDDKLTDSMATLRERTNQLETANKELEAFSYSVSHDLRAPLRAMDGFSLALLDEYAEKLDDQGRDYLNRVRAASGRMAQLIDDLLKLANVSRTELRHETVELSARARVITERLCRAEPDRRAEFVIQPGLRAEGDPEMMGALLTNLMENAWKFTSKKPPARIEFGAAEKGATFCFVLGTGKEVTHYDQHRNPEQDNSNNDRGAAVPAPVQSDGFGPAD